MRSDYREPLNLGPSKGVHQPGRFMIANMVGVQMDIKHVPCLKVYAAAIQITPLREVLRWEPQISAGGRAQTHLYMDRKTGQRCASDYSFGVATFPRARREV
jgi:hypothetical protein